MKLANGMGSVYKLSGRRRKHWVARKTKGWDILNDYWIFSHKTGSSYCSY